jgi:DNA replication and repair protein RecF
LIQLGSELIDARLDLVSRLSDPLVNAYRSVAGDDHHPRLLPQLTIRGAHVEDDDESADDGLESEQAGSTADVFRRALAAVRRSELDRGLTLIGPHRDDVLFELNGLPAKGYASHGESWSFALALKLASAELLRHESTTGDPVLILDDVFAELDQARRRMLATAVGAYEQVLITAAVFDDVPSELTAHTVRIEAGTVVEASGV